MIIKMTFSTKIIIFQPIFLFKALYIFQRDVVRKFRFCYVHIIQLQLVFIRHVI